MKDLLIERPAMSARSCHGNDEILFIGRAGLRSEFLIARTIFTGERLTIRCERHASATFRAHKSLSICLMQFLRSRWQLIGVDDLVRFEPTIQNCKRAQIGRASCRE